MRTNLNMYERMRNNINDPIPGRHVCGGVSRRGPTPCARRTEIYVQNCLPDEKSKDSCETSSLFGWSERIHVVFDVSIAHRSKRTIRIRSDSEFSELLKIIPSKNYQRIQ